MTFEHSYTYDAQPQSTVNRALCIADNETISNINETVELLGWRLDCVETISQAVHSLANDSYEALIVAVATDRFTLFDSTVVEEQHSTCMSSLLLAAGSKSPSTFRIVFGVQTEFPDIRMACINCGADAAINSSEDLFTALFGFMTPPLEDSESRDDNSNMGVPSSRREKQLIEIAGGVMTRRLKKKALHSADLNKQVSDISSDVLDHSKSFVTTISNDILNDNGDSGIQIAEQAYESSQQVHLGVGSGQAVRIVTVGNTNGKHRSLILPEGDIFLHAGNFTDGRTTTCLEQFKDFLLWLQEEVLTKYDQVAFIAGSQEFFLDIIACKYNAISRDAQKILNNFLSKHRAVAFLENTSVQYQGLKIYGTSTTLMKGARRPAADQPPLVNGGSIVRAFERAHNNFVRPDDCDDECDILLTHRPPSHIFAKAHYELPTDHLYAGYSGTSPRPEQKQKQEPEKRPKRRFFRKSNKAKSTTTSGPINSERQSPRLHAFGHYGKDFGMEDHCGTLLLNGSQDRVFREDKYGGGRPLIVDLPLYR